MKPYHIYHNDRPYTYFVWGPFVNDTEWDVEVHSRHVWANDEDTYMFTHTLCRDSHIVEDMWDIMDATVEFSHEETLAILARDGLL
jgi:hypothetical protein